MKIIWYEKLILVDTAFLPIKIDTLRIPEEQDKTHV